MSVKIRINGHNFTLSWIEFEKLILRKPPIVSVEILKVGCKIKKGAAFMAAPFFYGFFIKFRSSAFDLAVYISLWQAFKWPSLTLSKVHPHGDLKTFFDLTFENGLKGFAAGNRKSS